MEGIWGKARGPGILSKDHTGMSSQKKQQVEEAGLNRFSTVGEGWRRPRHA